MIQPCAGRLVNPVRDKTATPMSWPRHPPQRGTIAAMVGRLVVCFFITADAGAVAPSPSMDHHGGRLSKDAINQVVLAHLAAIKFCYERELQNGPTIAGTVDVAWNVEKDGRVSGERIANSTMNSKAVQECIARQVANWRFPVAAERTVVARYPFVFKGGTGTARPSESDAGAAAAQPSVPSVVRIWVSRTGSIQLDGKQVDLAAVNATLTELAKHKGAVLYGRDDPGQAPHPNAMKVMQLVVEKRLPIQLSTKRDFSDAVVPDGRSKD